MNFALVGRAARLRLRSQLASLHAQPQTPLSYFVIIGRLAGAGASLRAAGEITNVTHAFQPSARCAASNSL